MNEQLGQGGPATAHQTHRFHQGRGAADFVRPPALSLVGLRPGPPNEPWCEPAPVQRKAGTVSSTVSLARAMKLYIERELARLKRRRTRVRVSCPRLPCIRGKRARVRFHSKARGARQHRRVGRPVQRAAPLGTSDSEGGSSRKGVRPNGIKTSSSTLTAHGLGGRRA